jgi:hypothetical protein
MPKSTGVALVLIDASGRLIAWKDIDARSPGRYEAQFPSRTLATGQYTCVLIAGNAIVAKKIIVIR